MAEVLSLTGLSFAMRATARCSACPDFAVHAEDAEATVLDKFGRDAIRAFRRAGWRLCEPGGRPPLCPTCNPERADR